MFKIANNTEPCSCATYLQISSRRQLSAACLQMPSSSISSLRCSPNTQDLLCDTNNLIITQDCPCSDELSSTQDSGSRAAYASPTRLLELMPFLSNEVESYIDETRFVHMWLVPTRLRLRALTWTTPRICTAFMPESYFESCRTTIGTCMEAVHCARVETSCLTDVGSANDIRWCWCSFWCLQMHITFMLTRPVKGASSGFLSREFEVSSIALCVPIPASLLYYRRPVMRKIVPSMRWSA